LLACSFSVGIMQNDLVTFYAFQKKVNFSSFVKNLWTSSGTVVLNRGEGIPPQGASINFHRGASPYALYNMESLIIKFTTCFYSLFNVRGAWNKGQLLNRGVDEKMVKNRCSSRSSVRQDSQSRIHEAKGAQFSLNFPLLFDRWLPAHKCTLTCFFWTFLNKSFLAQGEEKRILIQSLFFWVWAVNMCLLLWKCSKTSYMRY